MTTHSRRSGFTLVELLVVMMIIAILASMTYGAMFKARETAREARTKALIAKLHGQMMARWESYRTRRVPMTPLPFSTKQQLATQRLDAVRYLMQMELPDNENEIPTNPTNPLSRSYRSRINAVGVPLGTNSPAECLYLILTTAAGEEGLSAYELGTGSVGDYDGDGHKEFVDGWGRPISFIRWPVGFVSELQPVCADPSSPLYGQPDPVNNHDPFDPMKSDPDAFCVFPLIYSAGPNGLYGLFFDATGHQSDPYANMLIAAPNDSDGDGILTEHFDNIHNHMIGTRQ